MTVTRLALVGDSTTQGDNGAYAAGGQGSWAELIRDRLANVVGIGPLISPGLRNLSLVILPGTPQNVEWTTAGAGWTNVVTTDAWDKAPYGKAQYANGSTNIRTYTVPNWMPAWHGFAIDWIDYTNGGNWSYRINGGAWTAMGQTLQNDNAYCRFYITQTMTAGQTIDIRAANAAGTGVGCLPVGIRPFFSAPSTTQGLIVDNYGENGERLHNLALATSGDRMAAFDTVRLGTGGAVASTPTITLMGHINDVVIANTTTWATDLTTFRNRVAPLGSVGFWSLWECNTGTYNQTQQTNYRAQTKTSAAAFSPAVPVLDIYDLWSSLGFTANAGAVAAGFLIGDAIHESQAGHIDLAPRFYWFVRNNFFSVGNAPSTYTATGKRAAVQYSGKQAAVQYSAGAPISVA